MIYLVLVDVMEDGVDNKLTTEQRVAIKRAIKALDDALFRFNQKGVFEEDWLEEIRLASLALEELLE
jgi:hypothetical protein